MDTNVWFYTFSTIAQVLAALIGLFAVFVVYKMQDFGDILESLRKKFVRVISHASSNTEDYESITYEKALTMDDQTVLSHMNELLAIYSNPQKPQNIVVDDLTRENRDLFETLITTKQEILKKLGVALILSLIAISASILALVFAGYFLSTSHATNFLLAFFAYFFVCLFYMGLGIYKISAK